MGIKFVRTHGDGRGARIELGGSSGTNWVLYRDVVDLHYPEIGATVLLPASTISDLIELAYVKLQKKITNPSVEDVIKAFRPIPYDEEEKDAE